MSQDRNKLIRRLALGATAALGVFLILRAVTSCALALPFTVNYALMPCPAATEPVLPPPIPETRKDAAFVFIPASSIASVGSSFRLTLAVDPKGIPVNAVGAFVTYPTDLVKLVAKDESVSGFAISFDHPSDPPELIMQLQPNPGVSTLTPLAAFTFEALMPGEVTITLTSSARVLANDGFGTDVLGSVGSATVTILPAGQ
jgi:hypothetical protein